MLKKSSQILIICGISFLLNFKTFAQNEVNVGHNNYAALNISFINFPFINPQLNLGYKVQRMYISNTSLQMIIGHQFNKTISGELSWTVPLKQPMCYNINGDGEHHNVGITIAGLSLKIEAAIKKNISIYGKAGLTIISRQGFKINDFPVVDDENYIGFLLGAGFQYQFNKSLNLRIGVLYSPPASKLYQRYAEFFSAGIKYNPNLHPAPEKETYRIFAKHIVQAGYATNTFGYGVNDFFEKGKIPIFWDGNIYIKTGVSLQYQQHLYNGKKFFSIYWGANLGYWKTVNTDQFFTVSIFPVFRFTLIRTHPATDNSQSCFAIDGNILFYCCFNF